MAHAEESNGSVVEEMDAIVVEASREDAWSPQVTSATRGDAALIEIPQSIQVIPRQLLDEQDAQNLADALVNVSGVVPTKSFESLILSPLVRGFPAELYIDGMPAYGSTAAMDPSSLINVESVEVIKGPTAALFGGGVGSPLGGIIHVVSSQPTAEKSYALGMRSGSENTFNLFADINQPLNEDGTLALRITGDYESKDSHIDHVHQTRWSLNPTLRWDISPETKLTIQAQFHSIRQLEYSGLPAALVIPSATENVEVYNGPTVDPFRFTGAVDAPDSVITNTRLVAAFEHRLSERFKTNASAQWYHNRFDEYSIYTFSSAQSPLNDTPNVYPVLSGYLPSEVNQTTLNGWLTGNFSFGPVEHEIIIGADLDLTENISALGFSHLRIPLPDPFPDTVLPIREGFIDFADPNSTLPYVRPALIDHSQNQFTTGGVFLQDHVTAWERYHLLGGIRLVSMNVDHQFQTENTIGSATRYDVDYLEAAPRFGGVVDLGAGVSAFAAYSEGFRGVLNYTGKEAPEPEQSAMSEAGVKFANESYHLNGSLAAYQLTRENVPTANPFVPGSTVQLGEQQSQGIELDLGWQPTPAFSLLATYAYTDAEVTEDIINEVPTEGQDIDRIGKRLARVPEHSGRIAARYRFQEGKLQGLGLGLGITAASKRPVSLSNNYFTEAYCVADAQISYETETWQAELSISNLTNHFYYEPYPYLGEDVVAPARPISFFFSITTRF
jgi:iron complex outermembrane receptor protein